MNTGSLSIMLLFLQSLPWVKFLPKRTTRSAWLHDLLLLTLFPIDFPYACIVLMCNTIACCRQRVRSRTLLFVSRLALMFQTCHLLTCTLGLDSVLLSALGFIMVYHWYTTDDLLPYQAFQLIPYLYNLIHGVGVPCALAAVYLTMRILHGPSNWSDYIVALFHIAAVTQRHSTTEISIIELYKVTRALV